MANPIPGTVIPSGTLVTPGGPQGVAGPIGPTGPTGAQGTVLGPVVNLSASYTATASDSGKYFIFNGGTWNLQLPAAAAGLFYHVRNDMGLTAASTGGIVTILPASGGPTIDGAGSLALLAQQSCTLINDGTNWRSFGRQREVLIGGLTFTNVANAIFILPDGYTEFELTFSELEAVSAGPNMQCQISTDHGNTWLSGSTAYYGTYAYPSTATAWGTASYSYSAWYWTHWIENAAIRHSVAVKFHPGNANEDPTFLGHSGAIYQPSGGYCGQFLLSGFYNAQGPRANALNLFTSSGNFARVTVLVKGRVMV